MNYKDVAKMIWKLWEEPTTIEAIIRDICFLFVSSYAFFIFEQHAGVMTRDYIIVTEVALTQINFGLAWSNFFINVLTVLVITEISSYIAKAYWDYRSDNL